MSEPTTHTVATNDLPQKLRQDALEHETAASVKAGGLTRASVAYSDGLRQAADELEASLTKEAAAHEETALMPVFHDCEFRRELEQMRAEFNRWMLALTEAYGELRIPDKSALLASEDRIETCRDEVEGVTIWRVKKAAVAHPAPQEGRGVLGQ